jgi:hypothetical protein
MNRLIRMLMLVVPLAGGLQGQKLSPAGDWDGVLVVGSGIELPIKLHLVSARGKTFTATVDSPSQQTMNIPVDRVNLAGNILKLDITAIGGFYEGKLDNDRHTLVGIWSQNGHRFSLNFKRQQKDDDWLIIPGVRVGPITPETTHAELIRLFGAKNVVDQDVEVDDAGPTPGSVVYKERPADSIVILWVDDKRDGFIDSLVLCVSQLPNAEVQKTCHWHTRENISFGTTLDRLETLNGSAFTLLGFAWDYGGAVASWNNGALERSLHRACGGLGLRLNPWLSTHPSSQEIALMDQVSGDKQFSSAIRSMHELNVRVDWMSVRFANCAHDKK